MMNYTKEQQEYINRNLKLVNEKYRDVLEVMNNISNEVTVTEIQENMKIGKFVLDKCLMACIVCGFVKPRIEGASKWYRLTDDGKKFLKDVKREEY